MPPRLPPYAHSPAPRRGTNRFAWLPGWRQTGQQPIGRVPVARYTQRVSQVPLTGGQAQGVIPGFAGNSGSAAAPAPFTTLAEVTVPVSGTYTVNWSVTLGGTLSAGDADNFHLDVNNGFVAASANPAAPGTYTQDPVTLALNAGDVIDIFNVAAGTAGSVYGGIIAGASQPLTLQVGPQGMGTTWYPIQVSTTTSTGALDTSTAYVYLGPVVAPITQVGIIGTGNGTAALAIPQMAPGQTLIVQWVGGHPGDQASMNVIGNMTALAA